MWITLATLSCFLWAIVFVLDSHLVGEVFYEPWIGVVVSAVIAAPIVLAYVAFLLFTGTWDASIATTVLALVTGGSFVVCQTIHFRAMKESEAGIVAAYWSMTPIFLVVAGHYFLQESLTASAFAGMVVLLVASILISLLDTNRDGGGRVFLLMIVGCIFNTTYYIGLKLVLGDSASSSEVLLVVASVVLSGLTPLAVRRRRDLFLANLPRLRAVWRELIAIELFHAAAFISSQYAVSYGTASLVATIEATLPGFTFVISSALSAIGHRFGDAKAKQHLPAKLLLVATIAMGMWLIS